MAAPFPSASNVPLACIHHVFENKAAANPEAIAVVFGNSHLTYRELNEKANQLARFLRRRGVNTESLVGVCVERSLDMLVSLLAVFKAGAAYVPLDPSYPFERLRSIIDDSGLAFLLIDARSTSNVGLSAETVIDFSEHKRQIAHEQKTNLGSTTSPANLAYVIYTSGSTGQPKGVQIEHRTVINLFEVTAPLLRFSPNDVWTVFHSFAFDLSVWEMWGCLLTGGRLVIVPRHLLHAPGDFYELVVRERVTILNQTPSAVRQLIYARRRVESSVGHPTNLRAVICGGEALPGAVAKELLGWKVPVWNFYGPTEATVWATALRVEDSHCCDANVSIGRPFTNVEVHVLDEQGNQVPAGEPGELYLGGECLARGYLNRPELMRRKFLPKHKDVTSEARIYKTGDWVRFRADGNLDFLGRGDHQVKINGFRVELGEVEKALEQHPAVDQSIVVLRSDENGTSRLVAYLVPSKQYAAATTDLRAFVARKLPDHMVPSAFVRLDAIPVTANGKVDRAALPVPNQFDLAEDRTVVGPTNDLERKLVAVWEDVLRVRPIGIHDNFFDLGGHSLLAVQLFTDLQKKCGANLPLAELVRNPSIAELAKALQKRDSARDSSCLVALQEKGAGLPLFCIHPVGGNILNYVDLSRRLGAERPFYALQAQGLDSRKPPHHTIEEMASHYVSEIRRRQPEGPYFVGGESFGGIVAFEVAQQLQRQGQIVGLLVLLDATVEAEPLRQWHRKVTRRIDLLTRLELREGASFLIDELKRLPAAVMSRIRGGDDSAAVAMPHLFEVVRDTNAAAHAAYKPRPFHGRAVVFRARESLWSGDIGWGALITGDLTVHEVPGAHGTFVHEPHVRYLAEKLRQELRDAEWGSQDGLSGGRSTQLNRLADVA